MDGWMDGWVAVNVNVTRMYLLLIGTERCCDVAAVGGCVVVCACVCGGDGCVGDTTNACTMYRVMGCLLYTSPSPRDQRGSRMPSSA